MADEKTIETTAEESSSSFNLVQQLRVLNAGFYDLQQMRIAAGNRLVSSFYLRLGYAPSDKKEGVDNKDSKETDKFKSKLLKEFKLIQKYMEENKCAEVKAVKDLFQKEQLEIIRDKSDYKIVESYDLLGKSEKLMNHEVDLLVQKHPLYEKFFSHVKGCGATMSGVILAYLNPYKAKYVSSFYMYAGLDTVQDKTENGEYIFYTNEEYPRKVIEKYEYKSVDDGIDFEGNIKDLKETDEFDSEGHLIYKDKSGEKYISILVTTDNDEPVYTVLEDGSDYVGSVDACEHGRRKGDVVDMDYIDKNGNPATKKSITYNPKLKAKLVGVLADCIIKAKDPVYASIYYDYKKKLNRNHRYDSLSDGHKNNMAKRYMMKQFLRNLWVTWRALEGLEINEPFEVAKLGQKPHKFNEYQYNMAKIAAGDKGAVINYTGEPNVYDYATYADDTFHGEVTK